VSSLLSTAISTIAAFALTVGSGWALITFVGGDWSLARFSVWSAGLAPLSAILHRLFRMEQFGDPILSRLRQLGAAAAGALVVFPITFWLDHLHPLMGIGAFSGTMFAYMLCHLIVSEVVRRPPTTSLERTREG